MVSPVSVVKHKTILIGQQDQHIDQQWSLDPPLESCNLVGVEVTVWRAGWQLFIGMHFCLPSCNRKARIVDSGACCPKRKPFISPNPPNNVQCQVKADLFPSLCCTCGMSCRRSQESHGVNTPALMAEPQLVAAFWIVPGRWLLPTRLTNSS